MAPSYKSILVCFLPIVVVALLHFAPITRNDLSIYETADWWNPNSSFAILRRMNVVRVPFFLKHGIFGPNRVVVDLGCGGGLVTEEIAKQSPMSVVTGFDMSAQSIEVAKNHGKGVSNLSYQVGSIYNLPLPNSSVDTVIVSDVFEHLDDLPKALGEIGRILKPGGIVVFDTIAKTWWSFLSTYLVAQEVLGIVEAGAHDWHMFINPEKLESMFVDAGFATNRSEWEGIVGNIDVLAVIRSWRLGDLISSFSVSRTDLSTSYMGYAVKT
jgi:2-polyprenyl-6-hydroxyphenyl methylase/3-demethylubiquinone-9 3-methyltransferase